MKYPDLAEMISMAMEKQSLIEKYLKLTEEQAESIRNDNYDSILNNINKKQNIIERVNLLNLEGQSNMPEDKESLLLITNQTKEMMSRAITIDNENILLLKNNQAQIFEKLKNAKMNKTTHATYRGKNVNLEGILVDNKK